MDGFELPYSRLFSWGFNFCVFATQIYVAKVISVECSALFRVYIKDLPRGEAEERNVVTISLF